MKLLDIFRCSSEGLTVKRAAVVLALASCTSAAVEMSTDNVFVALVAGGVLMPLMSYPKPKKPQPEIAVTPK